MGSFEDVQRHIQSPLPDNNTDGVVHPNETLPEEEEDIVAMLEELKLPRPLLRQSRTLLLITPT